jgi:hypothetical protein
MEQSKYSIVITWHDGAGLPILLQSLVVDTKGRMLGIDCRFVGGRKSTTGDARTVISAPNGDLDGAMRETVESALIAATHALGRSERS